LSYLSSFAVVLVGVAIGWYVASVNSVVLWIVSGLWGGYTASNVLKWYWWRFNGYGYFWGMVTGITGSLILPTLLPRVSLVQGLLQAHPVNMDVALVFPLVLAISLVGCLAGTLLTKPADEEVLKDFYRRVRPWGFWEPILAKVRAENPAFERNKDFWRDMFNVVVGIVWQVSLVALPIYLVIRKSNSALVTVAIIAVTSIVLKFTWYNHLKAGEAIDQAIARTDAVQSMPTA
jgi:heme/copper-type cytochrome/quinol oxidase subunit 4